MSRKVRLGGNVSLSDSWKGLLKKSDTDSFWEGESPLEPFYQSLPRLEGTLALPKTILLSKNRILPAFSTAPGS